MIKQYIAKKRFGQNFLNDQYIIGEIVRIINPKPSETMIEIGPGLGAITKPLVAQIAKLEVIEIDWDLIDNLKKKFNDQIIIHNADALKFDYNIWQKMIRIVGNLPYNISTPLLFHLARFNNILDMHFMLQKEVVDRICSKPDSKDYGRLSVMLQSKFECSHMLDVKAECFTPIPKIESAIVRLKPLAPNLRYNVDESVLNNVVTAAFGQRRKTIGNSLKNLFGSDNLAKLGIDPMKRAENLSVEDFVMLANWRSNQLPIKEKL